MNNAKKEIFEAALKLFAEHGYEKTTMDDIAHNACVAKGTLYYHFKSKEDIFNFVVEQSMFTLKSYIKLGTEKIGNPIDKLKQIALIQSDMIAKYNKFVIILLSQLWGNEERHIKFRTNIYDYINDIKNIIDEGIDKGVIANENSRIMAAAFFGMISSTVIYQMMHDKSCNPDILANSLIKYTLQGIQIK